MRDGDVLDNNPQISRSALAALHESVFGWAMSRCHYDRAVAEDLVQQAYVELLSGNARFDGRASLQTFVFAVVQNLAKSRYRRLQSRYRLLLRAGHEVDTDRAKPYVISACTGVWDAVQQLPARQRDVLELVFCRELTIEEAAKVMGVTIGTGRVHYERAKKALRAKFEDQPQFREELRS
jgi:RNA polymerase sigma-70 factor (ECF subfamily)